MFVPIPYPFKQDTHTHTHTHLKVNVCLISGKKVQKPIRTTAPISDNERSDMK